MILSFNISVARDKGEGSKLITGIESTCQLQTMFMSCIDIQEFHNGRNRK